MAQLEPPVAEKKKHLPRDFFSFHDAAPENETFIYSDIFTGIRGAYDVCILWKLDRPARGARIE
jgi:hypothetical protein